MDLRYWDAGTIRARTSSVLGVREGVINSLDSYDCCFGNS